MSFKKSLQNIVLGLVFTVGILFGVQVGDVEAHSFNDVNQLEKIDLHSHEIFSFHNCYYPIDWKNSFEKFSYNKNKENNFSQENENNMNNPTNEDISISEFEEKVVQLTNEERTKYGLQALQIDEDLSKVAREKSIDMEKNNYFDHTSPTYGSPFDMMKQFGINYQTAGENIAKGQQTPERVVQAWMDSPGHRENILNGDYTHIGVGYVENGHIWTQLFIGK